MKCTCQHHNECSKRERCEASKTKIEANDQKRIKIQFSIDNVFGRSDHLKEVCSRIGYVGVDFRVEVVEPDVHESAPSVFAHTHCLVALERNRCLTGEVIFVIVQENVFDTFPASFLRMMGGNQIIDV